MAHLGGKCDPGAELPNSTECLPYFFFNLPQMILVDKKK